MKSIATLLAPLVCLLAMGCDVEPEETEPTPEHTPLAQGAWQFHMGDPIESGSCDIDFTELDGMMLPSEVRTPGPFRVIIDLDGIELKGERGDGLLMATGFASMSDSEPDKPADEPDEEWTDENDGDDDADAPPPCGDPDDDYDEAAPVDQMSVYLDADVLDPHNLQGEMDIQINLDGDSCSVNLQIVGRHIGPMDDDDGEVPVTEVVEEVEEEEGCG